MSAVLSKSYRLSTARPETVVSPETDARAYVDFDPFFLKTKAYIDEYAQYPVDWDDEEGLPASEGVAKLSISMLREFAVVSLNHGVALIRPSVNLLNDGSVTLYWDVEHCQVYIIIGPGEDDIQAILRINGGEGRGYDIPRPEVFSAMDYLARLILAVG